MNTQVQLDDASVEAVAQRVVELLRAEGVVGQPKLLDVGSLAEALSVTRSYIYEHKEELGAVRLGEGARAPIRFDLDKVLKTLTSCSVSRGTEGVAGRSAKPKARRRTLAAGTSAPDLLPITPPTRPGELGEIRAAKPIVKGGRQGQRRASGPRSTSRKTNRDTD